MRRPKLNELSSWEISEYYKKVEEYSKYLSDRTAKENAEREIIDKAMSYWQDKPTKQARLEL